MKEFGRSFYESFVCFKLFVFDTGLLKHMAGIDNSAILLKTDYQFKGPLTENYVLQQLRLSKRGYLKNGLTFGILALF